MRSLVGESPVVQVRVVGRPMSDDPRECAADDGEGQAPGGALSRITRGLDAQGPAVEVGGEKAGGLLDRATEGR
ncbi:hypothetical protein AB0M05_00205 [Streptomyces violaceusniger]|uniref:hypothetical protein n=1 Tax=Streptomyces violaceusniger TaxID=68280 RepID=UPI00343E747B